MHMKKTNNCGELTAKDENKEAILMGWVHVRRDHGGVIFVDLRDREGLTQVFPGPVLMHRRMPGFLIRPDELRRFQSG